MKVYSVQFDAARPMPARFWAPQNSIFKIGLKVYKNGEELSDLLQVNTDSSVFDIDVQGNVPADVATQTYVQEQISAFVEGTSETTGIDPVTTCAAIGETDFASLQQSEELDPQTLYVVVEDPV